MGFVLPIVLTSCGEKKIMIALNLIIHRKEKKVNKT